MCSGGDSVQCLHSGLGGCAVDLLHSLAPGLDQKALDITHAGDHLWPGLAPGHVGLGRVGEMDPLCRGLKEHALPVLSVDIVDHGLVVTAPKLLIVAVSLGIWPPPEDRGSDIITHPDGLTLALPWADWT